MATFGLQTQVRVPYPLDRGLWLTWPSIDYSWFNGITDTAPQLGTATYRFRPSTGAVYVVEDTLQQPNGIAFSPDGTTIYISDTGAVTGPIDRASGPQPPTYHQTGKRTVYAFDLNGDGTYLSQKRPVYQSLDGAPDGLKVARNGYILTATGAGVDVLDAIGTLLLRVRTNYTVSKFSDHFVYFTQLSRLSRCKTLHSQDLI